MHALRAASLLVLAWAVVAWLAAWQWSVAVRELPPVVALSTYYVLRAPIVGALAGLAIGPAVLTCRPRFPTPGQLGRFAAAHAAGALLLAGSLRLSAPGTWTLAQCALAPLVGALAAVGCAPMFGSRVRGGGVGPWAARVGHHAVVAAVVQGLALAMLVFLAPDGLRLGAEAWFGRWAGWSDRAGAWRAAALVLALGGATAVLAGRRGPSLPAMTRAGRAARVLVSAFHHAVISAAGLFAGTVILLAAWPGDNAWNTARGALQWAGLFWGVDPGGLAGFVVLLALLGRWLALRYARTPRANVTMYEE